MNYLVFEAGGRAGLSAELFFLYRSTPGDGNRLILADMDPSYRLCPGARDIVRTGEDEALSLIAEHPDDCRVFPADELARQGKRAVFDLAARDPMVAVEQWFFSKRRMNEVLAAITAGCTVRIPETFALDDVFMRPNTMSAGSHGVGRLVNTCITRYVPIAREFVVDVDYTGAEPRVFARQVRIKNGYDKYLKFLAADNRVSLAAEEFVRAIRRSEPMLATGIFHIQLIEDPAGDIYFVEYSKRISGTSLADLYRGFNPFDAFAGAETKVALGKTIREETWYRYEDLLLHLNEIRL